MSSSPTQANRFLVCPQYSIFYRRQKKLEWTRDAVGDYQILFLLNGTLQISTPAGNKNVQGRQALLINPAINLNLTGKSVEFVQLALTAAFVSDHAARMHLLGAGGTVLFSPDLISDDSRLNEWAHSLVIELNEEKPGGEIVIAAIVEQILVHLLRNYANMRRVQELELSRAGLVDRRIRRSVELMHAQLAAELSLKEIAAASYLSPFHFARLFKKLTGTTPYSYLAALRTSQAQQLLTDRQLSIAEIGARVGYASPSHFTKAFRQATGLTPRAFRKALLPR